MGEREQRGQADGVYEEDSQAFPEGLQVAGVPSRPLELGDGCPGKAGSGTAKAKITSSVAVVAAAGVGGDGGCLSQQSFLKPYKIESTVLLKGEKNPGGTDSAFFFFFFCVCVYVCVCFQKSKKDQDLPHFFKVCNF